MIHCQSLPRSDKQERKPADSSDNPAP